MAQPLVREGEFAVKLAAALGLGAPADEAAAEDLLARAGVAPANGWLSDYPMTPQIIGQLDDAITAAAGTGALPVTHDQAHAALVSLVAHYRLPIPAETNSGSIPPPDTPPPVLAGSAAAAYYADAGPPVVTYYTPPADYAYLYDWVPYPVWWFGYWWPGFYICRDFTTVVVVQSRPMIVTNHVIIRGRTTAVIDPGGRHRPGKGRPMTFLRGPDGAAYRTVGEFREAAEAGGPAPRFDRGTASRGFSTPETQRSADGSYSRGVRGHDRDGAIRPSRMPDRPAVRPIVPDAIQPPPSAVRPELRGFRSNGRELRQQASQEQRSADQQYRVPEQQEGRPGQAFSRPERGGGLERPSRGGANRPERKSCRGWC